MYCLHEACITLWFQYILCLFRYTFINIFVVSGATCLCNDQQQSTRRTATISVWTEFEKSILLTKTAVYGMVTCQKTFWFICVGTHHSPGGRTNNIQIIIYDKIFVRMRGGIDKICLSLFPIPAHYPLLHTRTKILVRDYRTIALFD